MTVEYAPRGLVGVLTPQANTTVEPEFAVLLPPGYAAVNARLVSNCPGMEERLVDYFDHYEQACAQFANAPLSVLAFACTGASYLAGRERESRTLAAIERRFGVPAVTAATAVVDALQELGARRIALCSPYPEGLARTSVGYWESHGLQVVALATARTPEGQFHPIYSMTTTAASLALDELEGVAADAVVMLGTGMPTLGPIVQRRGRKGPPLMSCMLCLAWRAVHAAVPSDADLGRWLAAEHWGPALERAQGVSPPATR